MEDSISTPGGGTHCMRASTVRAESFLKSTSLREQGQRQGNQNSGGLSPPRSSKASNIKCMVMSSYSNLSMVWLECFGTESLSISLATREGRLSTSTALSSSLPLL
eukprot:scaffold314751_cov17-Tisochrysis_lutea.AAC.1